MGSCTLHLGIAQIGFDPPPALNRAPWGRAGPSQVPQPTQEVMAVGEPD